MSKLTKLRSNPKLFFKDVLKNRKRDVKRIIATSEEKGRKLVYTIENLNKINVVSNNLSKNIECKKDDYILSIIIPAYNSENSLTNTIDSLINQSLDVRQIEVLIINDGSSDNTEDLVNLYHGVMPNIKIINKQNSGVSSARNLGIKQATGKYIAFLDSDDVLELNTLSAVIDFFEVYYDDIDIVTYPLYYVRNGVPKCDHFRYKDILTHSGVYSIDEYPFICQTTVNVCVKNNSKILFNENMVVQEDQDFNFKTLLRKRKIGFVKEGGYYYHLDGTSLSSVKNNPLYSFDVFCNYYQSLFSQDKNDRYLQSLFLYNLQWRLKSDQLFPYFLDGEDYEQALIKLSSLINIVDIDLIMNFPSFDFFHKFFILKLGRKNVYLKAGEDFVSLLYDGEVIHKERVIEVVVNKIKIIDGTLKFIGVLKSVLFSFYEDEPRFYVVVNDKKERISLASASESYYKSKIKTADFLSFSFEKDISKIKDFKFMIEIEGFSYDLKFYFNTFSSISTKAKRYSFISNNKKISFNDGLFSIHDTPKDLIFDYKDTPEIYRSLKIIAENLDIKKDIWLYYDCKNVVIDNGLLQYVHDANINDNIDRYFIWNNDIKDIPNIVPFYLRDKFIPFGSMLHKILILKAKKIITSFIEVSNIYPFSIKDIPHYTDLFHFEIIYLQHGILHASMPHKYTQENLLFDKVVVSSYFEVDNFVNKYNVNPKDLILSGMPRFGAIRKNLKPTNRILFAPSWRSYLINNVAGSWEINLDKFKKSKYYQEINRFLSSPILVGFLEKNDIYLDFQLHPIFSGYKSAFDFTNHRINISSSNVAKEEYALFITDFSSLVFDFAYLERPIIYFVPDLIEFKSGMASYRELDLPFDKAFGNLVCTSDECLSEILQMCHSGKFKAEDIFLNRMKNFFLPIKHPEKSIYSYLRH